MSRGKRRKHDGNEKAPADAVCCGTCFFLDLGSDECRRAVPMVLPMPQGKGLATEWPEPGDEEWCGEWRHTETLETLPEYLHKHGVDSVLIGGSDEPDGDEDE